VLPGNHAASCTEPPPGLLFGAVVFKDYKTRSRMKLSERIHGPKALPLLGYFLWMIFYTDSKLLVFVCLAVCHERHHYTLLHYDFRVTISYMLHCVGDF